MKLFKLTAIAVLFAATAVTNALINDSILVKQSDVSQFESVNEFQEYLETKLSLELQLEKEYSNHLLLFNILDDSFEVMSEEEGDRYNENLDSALQRLCDDDNVKYAEPNIKLHAMRTPSDSRYVEQWHYFEERGGINLPKAWDITVGSADVVAAVVDTGIVKHDEYYTKVVPGRNFMRGEDVDDYFDKGIPVGDRRIYHGSHVAGTIAAENNSDGVVGVAWKARILPVKVLGGDDGSGSLAGIIEGMRWAAGLEDDKPLAAANLLNLSLGGKGRCSAAMQEAIDEIVAKDISVIVAAGNGDRFGNPEDASLYTPASCNNVITVAANNRQGGKAKYSNFGRVIDVAAPGGQTSYLNDPNGILSTHGAGEYFYLQGTSMATPHVSGLVALMLSVNPDLKPYEIEKYLKAGARGDLFGVGIIDAFKTLELVKKKEPIPDPEPNPDDEIDNNEYLKDIYLKDDPNYYFIDVPEGQFFLTVANLSSRSEPLMKITYERKPNVNDSSCLVENKVFTRQCIFYNPKPGRYYISLEAYEDDSVQDFKGLGLWALYR